MCGSAVLGDSKALRAVSVVAKLPGTAMSALRSLLIS